MALSLGAPVISPVIVGRGAHLDTLGRCLDQLEAGRGGVVLVSGEAGIGKTRLLAEARARAEGRGFQSLSGACFEPDRAVPFAPLLDLLRRFFLFHARSPRAVAEVLGPGAPDILRLLPELSALLPGVTPAEPADAGAGRSRLFHALTRLFLLLAARQRLLLVVEDLHWGDEVSLEFLLHLARHVEGQPLLVLLSFRSEEVHPGLGHFLAELDRARVAGELALPRLTPPQVDAMLRAILGRWRPVRPEFLEAVYTLSEGNPFFIEEILGALIASGEVARGGDAPDRMPVRELRIPRPIRDTVRRRSERLSGPARTVLVLAAVAGRHFDFALLRELTGHAEEELVQLIKEALGAQLVVEESADRFAFRHALTREALYAELLRRERRALHGRIAQALERLHASAADAHLADLAYHSFEAGAWEKALEYATRAGERARELYAPRAAVEQFTRALEAARQLALSPAPALHRARGLAYETLGAFEQARADHEAALDLARATGDRGAEWQALVDLGMLWAARDYARTGEYVRRAAALARELADPTLLAASLNRLGNWHINVEQVGEALRLHQEALAIFRALGDRRGMAATLDLLGMVGYLGGDLTRLMECGHEAVQLFRALDDRQGEVAVLATLILAAGTYQSQALAAGPLDLSAACNAGERALRLAREIEWRPGEAYTLLSLAVVLGPRGDYARAREVATRGFEIAEAIEHHQWLAYGHWALGALALDLLDAPRARQHAERSLALAQELGSWHWIRNASGLLARAALAAGDVTGAAAALDAVHGADAPTDTVSQRFCWYARGELALARGTPEATLQIVERLAETAARAPSPRDMTYLEYVRGEALRLLGHGAAAQAALEAARDGAAAHGLSPLLWRVHAALGTCYRDRGDPDASGRAFAAARAVVDELAARVPDASGREQFLRAAGSRLVGAGATTPARAVARRSRGPGAIPLTPREREVTVLAARGLTNRQIANELVVGERTVDTHIANALGKLGFHSRAQLAAWTTQHSLTADPTAGDDRPSAPSAPG